MTDACQPRHRHSEFLGFLKLVARAYPRRQLHVVLDNYATHKHERVQAWLSTTPAANHQLRLDPASGVHSGEGTQDMDPQQQPGTAVGSWSVELAVCAEMVFLDLAVPERVRRIADLGFQAEIWDWTTKDLDTLARTGPGPRP